MRSYHKTFIWLAMVLVAAGTSLLVSRAVLDQSTPSYIALTAWYSVIVIGTIRSLFKDGT